MTYYLGFSNKIFKRAIIAVLLLFLLCPVSIVSAAETDNTEMQLTIEDAVNKAIENSRDLKTLKYTIEQGDEALEAAQDEVKYTPADGDDKTTASAYLNLISTDISQQQNKKQIEVYKDTIVYNVNQKYTAVLTAQEAVKTAEDALAYAKFQRDVTRAGYQNATVSLISKNSAERDYLDKEAALTESKINLAASYKNLNTLLGLDENARPVLSDVLEYSALELVDLENKTAQIMDANPDIWSAKKSLEQAELKLTLYSGGTGSSNYTSTELGVYKTALSLEGVKEQARTTIRSSYDSIMTLEQQYQTTVQQVEAAEETLKVAELKYELGMVTKGEVLSAQVALNNAQKSLQSLVFNHELAKMTFEKPWVS